MTQKKGPELHALMEPATAESIAFGKHPGRQAVSFNAIATFLPEARERRPRFTAAFVAADEKSEKAGPDSRFGSSARDDGVEVVAVRHPC